MTRSRRYFLVHAMGREDRDFDFFFDNELIAVGWSQFNFSAIPRKQLTETVSAWELQRGQKPGPIAKKIQAIDWFLDVKAGDCVVVPWRESIAACIATNERLYDDRPLVRDDLDFSNQIRVEYLRSDGDLMVVDRVDLGSDLKEKMGRGSRGYAVLNLDHFGEELESLFDLPAPRISGPPPSHDRSDGEPTPGVEEFEERFRSGDFSAPDTWGAARVRVGVSVFRHRVLENFEHRCAICGMENIALLDAAHIRSWNEAPERRLDPRNGLALCVLHHRAFDRDLLRVRGGVVTIREHILKSENPALQAGLGSYHGKGVRISRVPVDWP